MTQYIDKAAIVAEIERMLEAITNDSEQDVRDRDLGAIYSAQLLVLRNLAKYLDTLKVKEVDFEKIWKEYFKYRGDVATVNVKHLAKHFFELGIKAKKGK